MRSFASRNEEDWSSWLDCVTGNSRCLRDSNARSAINQDVAFAVGGARGLRRHAETDGAGSTASSVGNERDPRRVIGGVP